MMRVVADSNVYISAFIFGGKPKEVLRLAEEGRIALALSPPLVSEVRGVLRDKFAWSQEQIDRALGPLIRIAQLVRPTQTLAAVTEDETDNRILECALAAGANVIVTGDAHLLKLKRFQQIEIVTPSRFLQAGRRRGRAR